uniref:hypothetical protein n=1 Tax=Bradyrhizobium sp. (strain ORS 278) TaxID=114615 RepID=UPI0002E0CC77|nr:hypothetical protein [Bradyrhizobium sp. ORS 278]
MSTSVVVMGRLLGGVDGDDRARSFIMEDRPSPNNPAAPPLAIKSLERVTAKKKSLSRAPVG